MARSASEETAMARQSAGILERYRKRDSKAVQDVNFDELVKELEESNALVSSDQLGDGFRLLTRSEKKKLIGTPFVILDWNFSPGVGSRGEKVTLRIKTVTNDLVIINDGSTGIYSQMRELNAEAGGRMIFCRKGLRVSEYDVTDSEGNPVLDGAGKQLEGQTFYLDFSAS